MASSSGVARPASANHCHSFMDASWAGSEPRAQPDGRDRGLGGIDGKCPIGLRGRRRRRSGMARPDDQAQRPARRPRPHRVEGQVEPLERGSRKAEQRDPGAQHVGEVGYPERRLRGGRAGDGRVVDPLVAAVEGLGVNLPAIKRHHRWALVGQAVAAGDQRVRARLGGAVGPSRAPCASTISSEDAGGARCRSEGTMSGLESAMS